MIEMEMDIAEFRKMFSLPISCDLRCNDVLTLGKLKYQVWEYELSFDTPDFHHEIGLGTMRKPASPRIKVSMIQFEEKSKEQQEAENAVKKAEESLKAAKAVLSTIKESN